jgi:hypothetical protein
MKKLIIIICAIIIIGIVGFYVYGYRLLFNDTVIGSGEICGRLESKGFSGGDCLIWKKTASVDELDRELLRKGFTKSLDIQGCQTFYFLLNPVLGFHRETSIVVSEVLNAEKADQLVKGLGAKVGSINVGEKIIYEVRIVYSRPIVMVQRLLK